MHIKLNGGVAGRARWCLNVCIMFWTAQGDWEAEAAAGKVIRGAGEEEEEGVYSQEGAGEEKGKRSFLVVLSIHSTLSVVWSLLISLQAEHEVYQKKYSTLQEAKEGLTVQLKQAWKQVQVTNDEVGVCMCVCVCVCM